MNLVEENNVNFLKEFSLIIVNEMPEVFNISKNFSKLEILFFLNKKDFAVKLNDICQKNHIHFIYLYTIGLIGYARVFGNNHTGIDLFLN